MPPAATPTRRPTRGPARWQTATAVAVTCFMGGLAVAMGAHEHRVDSAVEEARVQALALAESKAALEASLERASDAADVALSLRDPEVSSAAAGVSRAAASAAHTALANDVAVTGASILPPTWAMAPLESEPPPGPFAPVGPAAGDAAAGAIAVSSQRPVSAQELVMVPTVAPTAASTRPGTPPPSPTAAPSEDAASTLDPGAVDVTTVVEDPSVIRVLEGEVEDLESVERAVARLEEASVELAASARRVDGTTAVLEATTAAAALEEANLSLDARLAAVAVAVDATDAMIAAVGGRLVDNSAAHELAQARDDLALVPQSEIDRADPDAVATATEALDVAEQSLSAAQVRFAASHEAWNERENSRRDAVNASRIASYRDTLAAAEASLRADYLAASARHQDGWEGRPAGMSYANGLLPSSALCDLSFAPGEVLHCDAAAALERADSAYFAQTGTHLEVSSSYRSYGAQVATRYTKGGLAARPGTSNHGWGLAADFEPASAAWLRTHGEAYGWVHPRWARVGGAKPESWHLEYVAPGVELDAPRKPDLLDHVASMLAG
ncbi:hypothetical protein Lsed01_00375 [Demequina sediminis]|uniref:Peptidase M15B domain-containing protein n=2 Tax=Demequina sediminis TaxID=1930058 RepID=A0ABP9WDR3_9MICO